MTVAEKVEQEKFVAERKVEEMERKETEMLSEYGDKENLRDYAFYIFVTRDDFKNCRNVPKILFVGVELMCTNLRKQNLLKLQGQD